MALRRVTFSKKIKIVWFFLKLLAKYSNVYTNVHGKINWDIIISVTYGSRDFGIGFAKFYAQVLARMLKSLAGCLTELSASDFY